MKLTTLMLIIALVQASAAGYSQVTLKENNAPLTKVLSSIEKQTGANFFYNRKDIDEIKINVQVNNATLKETLDKCLQDLQLSYEIKDNTVFLSKKEPSFLDKLKSILTAIDVHGKIVDERGEPMPGVTISVKGTGKAVIADAKGEFTLTNVDEKAVLMITSVGYKPLTLKVAKDLGIIKLEISMAALDQIQVIGYGTTSKRLSTGNVSTITAETIAKQPVSNPLQALSGRVPGLQVTQRSGFSGDAITVQIRGRNSIGASNNPLYIVDGVPFTSTQVEYLYYGSPMNSISPDDIESISILKDADATAIYGSRASNGVVLITTKKGKTGKTKIDLNLNSGISDPSRVAKVLNTAEYLQMRKDAFANSGITPTVTNAPDLLSYDQNTDNNWQKLFMGRTASYTDASASFSGGTQQTTFLLSGTYHTENTVQFKNNTFDRGNVHFNFAHHSLDNKFHLSANAFYTESNLYQNGAGGQVLTMGSFVTSMPNYPIYNADGTYNWTNGNYLAQATAYNKGQTNNLNANVVLDYNLLPGLNLKSSLGYNRIQNEQIVVFPSTYYNPSVQTTGNSNFSNQYVQSLLFEPQITYTRQIAKGKLDLLAGATIQQNHTKKILTSVSGYTNNLLLESPGYGNSFTASGADVEYKYISTFARATYNWQDKYILNGTFRRDGSSRFGDGKKFGNFGSIGGAWIFTNEDLIKNKIDWLSYGKLRGSWGTTGNDGIGDFQYLNIYTNTLAYGTSLAIIPKQIANNDYSWEVNKKLEAAIDLGFLKDRILLSTAWYRNRSGNQLVTYALPSITGFTGYIANLPAIVQNTGWEFELHTQNLNKGQFRWNSNLNLTIPQNRLLSFPNLASSTYANTYIIGQSLNTVQRFHFVGVDPQTGLAIIQDVNGDGNYTASSSYNNKGGDYVIAGTTDPKWYGGLNNSFTFKNFQLDIFFQYTKQQGYNLLSTYNAAYKGYVGYNGWTDFLDYWRKPGDIVSIPKPLASIVTSEVNYYRSDAGFSDASFLRLKNVMLSYTLPESITRKVKMNRLRIYAQGQNVWTLTKYIGYDPELASSSTLYIPTMRTLIMGIQCSF